MVNLSFPCLLLWRFVTYKGIMYSKFSLNKLRVKCFYCPLSSDMFVHIHRIAMDKARLLVICNAELRGFLNSFANTDPFTSWDPCSSCLIVRLYHILWKLRIQKNVPIVFHQNMSTAHNIINKKYNIWCIQYSLFTINNYYYKVATYACGCIFSIAFITIYSF